MNTHHKTLKIGILALQGDFAKHETRLAELGVATKFVRTPKELEECDALIIPGGESTTIYQQMGFIDLIAPIIEFAATKPLFGTCAGLILMSRELVNCSIYKPLGLLDLKVERNSYGPQIDSFRVKVDVNLPQKKITVPAFFIRAPRIRSCGPEVKVLATYNDEPILVQQGDYLGATFHPELTPDTSIHEYFISIVKNSKASQGS